MKVVHGYPPNIKEIEKVFKFTRRVIFSWGDIIYNPDNVRMDEMFFAHEGVHRQQQLDTQIYFLGIPTPATFEERIREWWRKYLADPVFRAEQEKPAYRAQYVEAKKRVKNPEVLNKYARAMAEALSGDTYGKCMTFEDALHCITHG